MHYRHSFHAGNFADVFKHAVLCGLLSALNRKDKPWCYVETHAGAGAYELDSAAAQKTQEWRDGIGRLLNLANAPEPLATLLSVVQALSPLGAQRAALSPRYPGSPLFVRALARPGDRLVLCEKVPEIAAQLRMNVAGDRRIKVLLRDGYEAHSLLPPAEKRGLVLVDPPFEHPQEFGLVHEFLERAVPRFPGGVFAVWYPLKNRHAAARFERRAAALAAKPPLRLELATGAAGEGQMRACAVLVLNAPFGFAAGFAEAGRVLASMFARGPRAAFTAGDLTGEPEPGQNVAR
jgi:23S rRNA (adenine2030-N6)-methyltransferase